MCCVHLHALADTDSFGDKRGMDQRMFVEQVGRGACGISVQPCDQPTMERGCV
ncbi:hypothetical protein QQF64_031814, partial [Cirrhinus molitorella]